MKNTKIMISKTDFYNLYNRNSPYNKNRAIGEWANILYRRNIAFFIAYYFARFGISANIVTVSYLIIAIIANSIFIYPSIITLILLILLYELVYVLDSVDGQLARFHGTSSKYGELLDIFSDLFILAFFVMAFGIRLYMYSHNIIFILLANLGTISYIFEGLWVKNSDAIVGTFTTENSNSLMHRIRIYFLSIDDVSTLALILFFLTLLQKFFMSINFVEWFFILYIFVLFLTKIFLRYCFIFMKSNKTKKTVWKGWDD